MRKLIEVIVNFWNVLAEAWNDLSASFWDDLELGEYIGVAIILGIPLAISIIVLIVQKNRDKED